MEVLLPLPSPLPPLTLSLTHLYLEARLAVVVPTVPRVELAALTAPGALPGVSLAAARRPAVHLGWGGLAAWLHLPGVRSLVRWAGDMLPRPLHTAAPQAPGG